MNITDKILNKLINCDKTISGEDLANSLNISRNAVWKSINSLRQEGYQIDAATNKGYILSPNNKRISEYGIKRHLKNEINIKIFDEVDSTNTLAKSLAENGEIENTLVIARKQTKGRGRMGKSFFSPDTTGIYMSIILKPQLSPDKTVFITTAAAVAVSEAIDSICRTQTQIKWVNDIFLNNKKICGILTEGSVNFETGFTDYAVLGIGINLYTKTNDFPEELKDIAGSIFQKPCNAAVAEKLIADIINRLFAFSSISDFMEIYRKKSFLTGKTVNFKRGDEVFSARVLDIDNNAHLVVERSNGKTEKLFSGEVTSILK